MNPHRHIFLLLSLATLLCAGCGDNVPIIEVEEQGNSYKENMINANRVVIQSESTQIDSYLQRHQWTMQELPCGARCLITHPGSGAQVKNDDTVAVTYRLEALDETPFYTKQIDTLVVGRRQVTQALDDLLPLMRQGNTDAVLIAPSNCAYGVVGDGDRVPSRSVIIYKIKNIKSL